MAPQNLSHNTQTDSNEPPADPGWDDSRGATADYEGDGAAKTDQAALSVMHPESYDPEWRYYHGAWGG